MTEKEILLTSILHCSRSALYSEDWTLNNEQEKRLFEALSLRSQGMPLQYILGEVEFFGLVFKVDKRVLIPRPETELLVEAVIRRMKDDRRPPQNVGGRPPELCGGRRTTDDRRRTKERPCRSSVVRHPSFTASPLQSHKTD